MSVSSVLLAFSLVFLEANHVRIAVKILFSSVVALSLTMLAFKIEEECNPKENYHQLAKGWYYEQRKDFDNALIWYQNAAYNGNSEACCHVAVYYDFGYGVKQNYETALLWYQKVMQYDYPDPYAVALAYNNIGVFYQKGNGVEKDLQKAMDFFQMALKAVKENAYCFEGENSLIVDKIKEHINELE